MDIAKITRPSKDLVERVRLVGSATASATLAHMGIRRCNLSGPVSQNRGKSVAGRSKARSLVFMAMRLRDRFTPRRRRTVPTSCW